jgi:hypothetical protein
LDVELMEMMQLKFYQKKSAFADANTIQDIGNAGMVILRAIEIE